MKKKLIDTEGADLSSFTLEELEGLEAISLSFYPHLRYSPMYPKRHVKQQLFHCNTTQTRLVQGGNQSGKSLMGAHEFVYHLTGIYPDWYPESGKIKTRPVKLRVGVADFDKGWGENLQELMLDIIPAHLIRQRFKNQSGWIVRVHLKDKSSFDVMTYKQEDKLWEGWQGDGCIEENQRVLKTNGQWVAIKDIQIGDKLLTAHANNLKAEVIVKNKIDKGMQAIVKIQTKNGYELLCTPDHKIWTNKGKWIEASKLNLSDYLYSPKKVYREALRRLGNTKSLHKGQDTRKRFVSRECVGEAKVYDLSVESIGHYRKDRKPETHSFICEGIKVSNCWFDEPPRRSCYVATQRGLIRRNGRMWLTMTPLFEPWIATEIWERQYEDDKFWGINVDIRDNPYLTEDQIKTFENTLTPDEKEARLHGRFLHLAGLVYKDFWERNIHTVEPFKIPDNWTKYFILDPHDRKPFAWIRLAVNETEDVYIYDEYPHEPFEKMPSSDLIIEDYADTIKTEEAGIKVYRRFIDPIYGNRKDVHTNMTIKQDLGRFKLDFEDAIVDKTTGHLKVMEYLKYNKEKPYSPINHPKLYVFNTCRNFVYGMEHYVHDEGIKKLDNPKCFPDLVRYGLMGELRYIDPEERKKKDTRERARRGGY